VMRFRQGGFVEHPEDYKDEPIIRNNKTYYWYEKFIWNVASNIW
jgi:hypothetical protein